MLNKLVSINCNNDEKKLIFSYMKEFTKHTSMPKNSYIKHHTFMFYPNDVYLVLSEINDVFVVDIVDLFFDFSNKRSFYKILKDNNVLIVDKTEFKTI